MRPVSNFLIMQLSNSRVKETKSGLQSIVRNFLSQNPTEYDIISPKRHISVIIL